MNRYTKLVSFANLDNGEVFMFSMKDRVKFKKIGSNTYTSLSQSPETATISSRQLVIKPIANDYTPA